MEKYGGEGVYSYVIEMGWSYIHMLYTGHIVEQSGAEPSQVKDHAFWRSPKETATPTPVGCPLAVGPRRKSMGARVYIHML